MTGELEPPKQETKIINDNNLASLAIYLEGMKAGKGNLQPLGTTVLDDLWAVVHYLRGDARYKAKRDR